MKKKLKIIREKYTSGLEDKERGSNALFSIAFKESFYSGICSIKSWMWWNKKENDYDLLKYHTTSAIIYFTLIPIVNFTDSYSMIESYYQTYSLFETDKIIDALINTQNLYHDDSDEAKLAALLAIYENEMEESVQSLLDTLI